MPIDRQIEASIEIFLFFENAVIDGRNRFAFTRDLSRDTHHHFAHRARIDQHERFRLAEHVNETRRHDLSAGIDFASCLRAAQIADANNTIVFDRDVGK